MAPDELDALREQVQGYDCIEAVDPAVRARQTQLPALVTSCRRNQSTSPHR